MDFDLSGQAKIGWGSEKNTRICNLAGNSMWYSSYALYLENPGIPQYLLKTFTFHIFPQATAKLFYKFVNKNWKYEWKVDSLI